ncbi:hypothetical protein BGC31_13310 [Komagataeibacter xylinus]|nr:hypothetical protein BGC31_13310 [Komagataeibacter xylinus]RFP07155.1 hypothetical protein BFX83_06635 [Komagataeibacter xylinus]
MRTARHALTGGRAVLFGHVTSAFYAHVVRCGTCQTVKRHFGNAAWPGHGLPAGSEMGSRNE